MNASANTSSSHNHTTGTQTVLSRSHAGECATQTIGTTDRALIVNLLHDALTREMACVFRYRRHHFIARSIKAPELASEFLLLAKEELEHANKIAERIAQLGGESALKLEPARNDNAMEDSGGHSATAMIAANLANERATIDQYSALIRRIDAIDSVTGCMLKEILADEEVQAGALAHRLAESSNALLQPPRSAYAISFGVNHVN